MSRFPKYVRDEQTARTVLTMTGYGITQERIGRVLQLDGKTLRAHYRRELDIGATEADARVVESLYRNATKNDNVAAQIWWTKARMGWKGTDVVQQEGAQPFAIFVPTPIDSTHEWLRQHAPDPQQIEHDQSDDER